MTEHPAQIGLSKTGTVLVPTVEKSRGTLALGRAPAKAQTMALELVSPLLLLLLSSPCWLFLASLGYVTDISSTSLPAVSTEKIVSLLGIPGLRMYLLGSSIPIPEPITVAKEVKPC